MLKNKKLLILTLLIIMMLAPFIVAVPFAGWPNKTLYVYLEDAHSKKEIKKAIKIWNESQQTITFKQTKKKTKANITVRTFENETKMKKWCTPLRTINAFSWGIDQKQKMTGCTDWQGYKPYPIRLGLLQNENRVSRTTVAVHELGHVIGLPHTNKCSIMQPSIGQNNCKTPQTTIEIIKCRKNTKQTLLNCPFIIKEHEFCGPTNNDIKTFNILYKTNGANKPKEINDGWCETYLGAITQGLKIRSEMYVKRKKEDWKKEGVYGSLYSQKFNFQARTAYNLRTKIKTIFGGQEKEHSNNNIDCPNKNRKGYILKEIPAPVTYQKTCQQPTIKYVVPYEVFKAAVTSKTKIKDEKSFYAWLYNNY